MANYDPCDAWNELLYGKNRGEIYQYFLDNRAALIDHLKDCETCHLQASLLVESTVDMISQFESMSTEEFATLIREMYKRAAENTWDDDTQS